MGNNDIIRIVNNIPALASVDRNYIVSCTESNEWEVAFDYLCSKILENEITISKQVYEAIEAFGRSFGLDESKRRYWTPIQHLAKE